VVGLWRLYLGFLYDLVRHFVLANPNKSGVPETICIGPFQKSYLHNELRFNPNAFLHHFRSKSLTPPSPMRFGQIDEWAVI
jgi:hypothetical protein